MASCLVTKLKETINNGSLEKLSISTMASKIVSFYSKSISATDITNLRKLLNVLDAENALEHIVYLSLPMFAGNISEVLQNAILDSASPWTPTNGSPIMATNAFRFNSQGSQNITDKLKTPITNSKQFFVFGGSAKYNGEYVQGSKIFAEFAKGWGNYYRLASSGVNEGLLSAYNSSSYADGFFRVAGFSSNTTGKMVCYNQTTSELNLPESYSGAKNVYLSSDTNGQYWGFNPHYVRFLLVGDITLSATSMKKIGDAITDFIDKYPVSE